MHSFTRKAEIKPLLTLAKNKRTACACYSPSYGAYCYCSNWLNFGDKADDGDGAKLDEQRIDISTDRGIRRGKWSQRSEGKWISE